MQADLDDPTQLRDHYRLIAPDGEILLMVKITEDLKLWRKVTSLIELHMQKPPKPPDPRTLCTEAEALLNRMLLDQTTRSSWGHDVVRLLERLEAGLGKKGQSA